MLHRLANRLCVALLCSPRRLGRPVSSAASEPPLSPMPEPSEFMEGKTGHRLAVRRWPAAAWRPQGAVGGPKATVVLQHGGGWHSGYYDGLGTALSEAGYEVVALDAMGHGYSEGPLRTKQLNEAVTAEQGRTEEGVTYWTSLADVSADLGRLLMQERAKRSCPTVVVAESMGVLVAMPLVLEGGELGSFGSFIDGIITTGGLMRITKETQPPGLVCFLFEVLGRFFPKKNLIISDLDKTFDSAFGDARWAAAARADPLISTNSFYLGPASQNFRGMKRMRGRADRLNVPLLVMHSETDTRTDVKAAKDFYAAAGSGDKEIRLYPDASHLLFLDSEQNTARAIEDMTAWLDSRYTPLDRGYFS